MTVEYYEGQLSRIDSRPPAITIHPRGEISVRASIGRYVPAGTEWIKLAYDRETLRLELIPQPEGTKGAARCIRRKGAHFRIWALNALRWWKLVPRRSLTIAARWVGDCGEQRDLSGIVAILPAAAPIGEKLAPRDATLDRAIKNEDEIGVEEALTALPLKQERKICGNCFWCRAGHCINSVSDHNRELVAADDSCAQFKRQAVHGEPVANGKIIRNRSTRPLHKRARVLCRVCQTEHTARVNGQPCAHDQNGVDYRAGRGDKAQRCLGNDKIGIAIK